MRRSVRSAGILIALALLLTGFRATPASARDLLGWIDAKLQSLIGQPANRDVIEAPGEFDRQMVQVPPLSGGTMRIIVPPEKFRQQ